MDRIEMSLRRADPASSLSDDAVGELIREMSDGIRHEEVPARGPSWWKRPRLVLPLAFVGVVALTGASIVIPLRLWVDGQEVELDAYIPIQYTTESGVDVSCTYAIHFGDPDERTSADERAADYLRQHDWNGIGQRVYDHAMAHPFVPGPDDNLEVDNQQLRDQFSFTNALQLIWDEIPHDIHGATESAGATMDCTGQLR